jgi:hypothetical protein
MDYATRLSNHNKEKERNNKKIREGSKNPPPSKVSRKRDQREARVKI